ncbi:Spo0B C-terminal domain-containing protein [Lederbergia citrea]|uniref:Spo0B C-terminal domain-containing protein n=1 Tax=Lederbergia citrea TaxID=2833581 RepID=UPI001BC987C1|nr:Spo0B C-terminal domain-containing protein [Lederbergia citrea]MBS4176206.1 Spo0B domain-containing protein [Lederbergia citrea]
MNEKCNMIEVLQHTRHDWLNRLQLIKGNIELGKIEQAKRIINEIVLDTQHEARLTNLKLPEFASMLLTHNWSGHSFRIEYEIVDDLQVSQLDDKLLANWMHRFFRELDDAVHPLYENHLYITIEPLDNKVLFLFHCNGVIKDSSALEQWLRSEHRHAEKVEIRVVSKSEIVVEAIFN